MILKKIKFKQDEHGDATPDRVIVDMSIKEALWAAMVPGKQRGTSPHNGIYNCLVGGVFNRYFEGGTDDAKHYYDFQIPPIKYGDKNDKTE